MSRVRPLPVPARLVLVAAASLVGLLGAVLPSIGAAALDAPSVIPGGATSGTYNTPATVSVQVPGATGSVVLKGVGPWQSQPLSDGAASFELPAVLAVGTYTVTYAYSGSATTDPGQATSTYTVVPVKAAVSTTLTRKPSSRSTGSLQVRIAAVNDLDKPSGKVSAKLVRKGKTRAASAVTVHKGSADLVLPRLTKGAWRLKVTYRGINNYGTSSTSTRITVG